MVVASTSATRATPDGGSRILWNSSREPVQPYVDERAVSEGRREVRAGGLPAPVGGGAGIEQSHPVRCHGVPGDVAVSEDEHVPVREPPRTSLLATRGRSGLVYHGQPYALDGQPGHFRQAGAQGGAVVVAVHAEQGGRPRGEGVEQLDVDPVTGVDDQIGGVDRAPQL